MGCECMAKVTSMCYLCIFPSTFSVNCTFLVCLFVYLLVVVFLYLNFHSSASFISSAVANTPAV